MNWKRLIQNIGYNLHFSSAKRGAYCREKDIFHYTGNDVRLPSMILPLYPKLLSIHDNVEVATGVRFVVHDAIHGVINGDGHSGVQVSENVGCIEIMDNVFIGEKSVILPGVKIGPNAIIGAGSVVTKNVPANSVCVGVPAKQISSYDAYVKKHEISEKPTCVKFKETEENVKILWGEFHSPGGGY